jgi:chemotaxis protein methyltransferase CheR
MDLWPDVLKQAEIMATDVSKETVERAREGFYNTLEVNRGLGAKRLVRHFEPALGGFRVKREIRERVSCSTHNLLGAFPDPTNCDLVLCRNVLIYFSETDRNAVVRRLVQASRPDGYVGVGSTELLPGKSLGSGWYTRDGLEARK